MQIFKLNNSNYTYNNYPSSATKISHLNCGVKVFYPSFKAYEKTFVMIKPDAFERRLDNIIMERFKDAGLKVSSIREGIFQRKELEEVYSFYRQKEFFKEWIDYLTRGKIRVIIIEGENAVKKALGIKNIIRNEYSPNEKRYNLIHSSDTEQDAKRESSIFFHNKLIK